MSEFHFYRPDSAFSAELENFVINLYGDENAEYREQLLRDAGVSDPRRLRDEIEAMARGLLAKTEGDTSQSLPPFFEAMTSLKAMDATGDASNSMISCLRVSFEQQLAERCVELASVAEDRYLELLLMLKDMKLTRNGAQFMRRISRCYLYGFDAECVVMCRALLEAEFQAEISNDQCTGVLGPPRSRPDGSAAYDLVDRIAVALKEKRIDQELSDKAHLVRKAANRVIHRKPALDGKPLEVVRAALDAITGLYESGEEA